MEKKKRLPGCTPKSPPFKMGSFHGFSQMFIASTVLMAFQISLGPKGHHHHHHHHHHWNHGIFSTRTHCRGDPQPIPLFRSEWLVANSPVQLARPGRPLKPGKDGKCLVATKASNRPLTWKSSSW